MSVEAKFLSCIRCGQKLRRYDSSSPFFSCEGRTILRIIRLKHPPYLISSRFDTREGKLSEKGVAVKIY